MNNSVKAKSPPLIGTATLTNVTDLTLNRFICVLYMKIYKLVSNILKEKRTLTNYLSVGGNVIRGDRTVMQMKSLRDHPDMSYGSRKQWKQSFM